MEGAGPATELCSAQNMYVARRHRYNSPPTIDDALKSAISKVRSDNVPNDWVLAGFEGRDSIQLINTGTGGIEVRRPKTWSLILVLLIHVGVVSTPASLISAFVT